MFCPKCGKEIPNDANMCPYCGVTLSYYTHMKQPSEAPKKDRKSRNSIIKTLIICISCVVVVAICGSLFVQSLANINISEILSDGFVAESETPNDNENIKTTKSSNKKSTPNKVDSEKGATIGAFNVKYKNSTVYTKSNGKKILIVTYSFTNNSSENASFAWNIDDNAFQNGIELERGFVYGYDGYDSGSSSRNIQPGKSMDIQEAYELRDDSKVEIQLGLIFSDEISDKFYINVK